MTRMAISYAICLIALFETSAQSADFRGIGFLPGDNFYSQADGVSADGRVVVGHGRPGPNPEDATLWTRGSGIQYIGDLPGGDTRSLALDISANRMYVVGRGFGNENGVEAFRWSQAHGMEGLGFLSETDKGSAAAATSGDGAVVVGYSNNYDPQLGAFTEAFRWTEAGGMIGLGEFPGGTIHSQAEDVSADGSVVIGNSNSALGYEAFRWTETQGMTAIGDLPGGLYESLAGGISASGEFIVGASFSEIGHEAYVWDSIHGMRPLGVLPEIGNLSNGLAVSDDVVVVGYSGDPTTSNFAAFIWTEADGIRNLQDVLVNEYGLGDQLAGWTLTLASDITPDGQTIVGYGINPGGNREGWVFSVPEPSSHVLAAILALAFAAIAYLKATVTRAKRSR